jgi:ubiquitin C-terminal hydrolase
MVFEHVHYAHSHWNNSSESVQVKRTMTLDELKNTIREAADVQADDLWIWPCCKRKNETMRTLSLTRFSGDAQLNKMRKGICYLSVIHLMPEHMPWQTSIISPPA